MRLWRSRAAQEQETTAKEQLKAAVWDVAEQYWGKGANYNRTILQDGFALVNALRNPDMVAFRT